MPVEIRKQANVHAGTRFTWEVDDNGTILLKPMRLGLADVAGMYKVKKTLTDEDIRKAIEEGYASGRD
jgi:bifunctional DNA-binding transcriptional regulator/antitoxin component of YhaV-PrlF toxin-antitoxin module